MNVPVALPPPTDPRWQRMVTGELSHPWSALGLKILMVRIQREAASDPSAANIQKCACEIHMFFQKNRTIAQDDLAAILL